MYSDIQIIHAIKNETKDIDSCFKSIYQANYKKAIHYFRKKGVDDDQIKDLFQDALIVLYETVKKGNYRAESSIATFLFSVMNHKWINLSKKLKNNQLKKEHILTDTTEESMEDFLISKEKTERIEKYMNKLQMDCKKILVSYYYQQLNMKEIAMEMGYKNEQIARNRKSLCMKALQQIIFKSKFNSELLS